MEIVISLKQAMMGLNMQCLSGYDGVKCLSGYDGVKCLNGYDGVKHAMFEWL